MKKINVVLNCGCSSCGSFKYEIRPKAPHVGIYCKCCGKWLKWLSRFERKYYGFVEPEKINNEPVVNDIVDTDDCPFD